MLLLYWKYATPYFPFPSHPSTQKRSTLTLGVNIKKYFHPPNNCSKFLFYLSKVLLQKESCGYAKVIKKSIEKMDKCPNYIKQWELRCPPKKRERKIAHDL
jgi:hypothetical protein